MMQRITVIFGILLTLLAVYGYFGAEEAHRSGTAWIPAGIGVPLIVCGLLAFNERRRQHAMHVAAGLALLGTLAAGGRGLPRIGGLFADDPNANRRAIAMVLAMFVLCAIFLLLCVKSFVDARRRRNANTE